MLGMLGEVGTPCQLLDRTSGRLASHSKWYGVFQWRSCGGWKFLSDQSELSTISIAGPDEGFRIGWFRPLMGLVVRISSNYAVSRSNRWAGELEALLLCVQSMGCAGPSSIWTY